MCGIFCCMSWLCADEWLGSLSSWIITQQGVCVFSCCWLFHCFPQWKGFIHYLPSGSFVLRRLNFSKLQQFVCQSGCSLDCGNETKGSETMQQITKLRCKVWISWAGNYCVIKNQSLELKLADAALLTHKRLNKVKNCGLARLISKCDELHEWVVEENTFSIFFWMFCLWTCARKMVFLSLLLLSQSVSCGDSWRGSGRAFRWQEEPYTTLAFSKGVSHKDPGRK